MKLSEKLREKLGNIPDSPGCYIMRDRRGRIIYVGKAISLRKRVKTYFREANLRRGSPKLRGLVKSVDDIEFVLTRNEAEALLTEGQLIKDYRPRYNISFKDDKRFMLLKGNIDDPFPVFTLCRIKRDNGAVYFGPYVSSSAARATLDFVEKKFGLKKCAPKIPDKETHKHCINDIVRFCSAPCVGRISTENYSIKFEEACAFLRGELPGYLKELHEEMERASGEMDFERAAAVRDTLFCLNKTIKAKTRISSTPEMKEQQGKQAVKELKKVLNISACPRTIEAYDVSNISGTYSVASMVCFIDGMPCKNRYRRFRIKTVEGINDVGMMAEVIRRRFTRLQKEKGEMPDLVLVDGGMNQLHAARIELALLGVKNLATAGLAKRFEELYFEENKPPIQLARNSYALMMLQRLRDEAHRFAITYHRALRNRRIKESLLDDIPGIGKKRKRLILAHFGSVRRLGKASPEEIAKIPGIGYEIALSISKALLKKGTLS